MQERPTLDDLTPYEHLVRLALTALGLLTLLALLCILPWRGLSAATANPEAFSLSTGTGYVILRVALRAFPWAAGLGALLGWGLFAARQPRLAFFAAILGLGGLILIVALVLGFTLFLNLGV
jgi:hypothetical protein